MHSCHELTIVDATLHQTQLAVSLSDGRTIIYPLQGMDWITEVRRPAEQQTFETTEWEIYWPHIDDGITLEHLLSPRPRVDFTQSQRPNWQALQDVLEQHQKLSTNQEQL